MLKHITYTPARYELFALQSTQRETENGSDTFTKTHTHNILKAEQAFKDVIKCAMNRQFKMKSAFLPSLNG